MTSEARTMARVLLAHHRRVCRPLRLTAEQAREIINDCTIEYGQLCERAGRPYLTHVVGHFLGVIADWCNENGWPPLNALAINAGTWMPGEGYSKASGCHLERWPEEAAACIVFRDYPDDVP